MINRIQQTLLCAVVICSAACSVAGPAPTPTGEEEFALCQQCHTEKATGNHFVNAPSIAGLPQWYVEAQLKKFKSGGRGTHFDDITGMQMRPMAMSLATDDEIKVISTYIAQLPPTKPPTELTGGVPEHGKTLYTVCVACHQADGSGNELLKAPPLNHASDWYLFSSLEKFKAGIRGTNPADISGAGMRPMATTLATDQDMKDVIAYIMTLRN